MNKFLSVALGLAFVGLFGTSVSAQTDSVYTFKDVKILKHTSVKDQYRSGTCWSFSGNGFLEAELIRTGKGEFDLSDMYVVKRSYSEKAEKYVRLQGSLNFGGGGAFHDVTNAWKNYGVVPESAFAGLQYGEEKHVHGELDAVLKAYMEAVIKNPNKKLSTAWHAGLDGILDAYLGATPEKFTYNGKEYTPKSFADYLGLNMDDYIEISSYTHHPFYKPFIIEVPDNWSWNQVYNLPLEDMMKVINNSLENGYTVGWASDVSEKGFAYNKGIAVVPETSVNELAGSEKAKWEKMTEKERMSQMYNFDKVVPEKKITQEMRQAEFDNQKTTDDHGMLLVGYADGPNGARFYKVKNSWNVDNKYEGYFYASIPFVEFKTMSIMVNKKAIPAEILKKLGL
ncbi:MAG TPA: C1 family peptidase [Bacteroidales bacterium]|nr:C1 family peptidase [Bacteroidales bacterium]